VIARNLVRALLTIAGLGYPLVMYRSQGTIPALAFVTAGILLIGGHLATLEGPARELWWQPMLLAGLLLACSSLWDGQIAAKSYPVVMSLAAALAFARSLVTPPSLIERLARLQEPVLPLEGQRYCRQVTKVWTAWLLINAVVAACLAAWGTDALWALWTGVVSYVVMGALLSGEIILRRIVRRRTIVE
jgi:uncharacterized membrane protein